MKCTICGQEMTETEDVMCAKEAIQLFNKPHRIEYENIKLYRCPCCTHMQIKNQIADEVYENEYGVDYASWKNVKLSDRFYLNKLSELSREHDTIFEIGCGEGRTLELATEFFDNVVGIEPAQKQANIARHRIKNKGTIINDFFTEKYSLDIKFDAFYSKMVFEHLSKPVEILKNITKLLKPGGVGWINVPNGQRIYDENLYQLFSFVHIQYYTPLSICLMAHKAGLEVLDICSHEGEQSQIIDIDIIVRKPYESRGKFQEQKEQNMRDILKYISTHDNVTIWGAGTKAHKYIELIGSEINIKHIIDKSSVKQGKYISNLMLPIESVSYNIIHESDVIVIFASMYNCEIIDELKGMDYKGRILYFHKGRINQMVLD